MHSCEGFQVVKIETTRENEEECCSQSLKIIWIYTGLTMDNPIYIGLCLGKRLGFISLGFEESAETLFPPLLTTVYFKRA